MFSFRDFILFLAGAEFFHTLSHILIPFFLAFPMEMKYITLTSMMNAWAIGINALITIGLIFWAKKIPK